MKKFKRTVSLALCAAALMSMTGCGGGNKTEKEAADIPTLKWYVTGNKQQDIQTVMDAVNKITEEKIGAKLDIQFIEDGAFQQKMTMMMASNEDFDLCFTGYVNTYATAAENGGLLELDDMLDSVPKLKEAIPEDCWESARYNGKIYAVPNIQVMGTLNAYAIDKEFAEKYNFDISSVKEPEDLEPLLAAIKENEPEKIPYRANYATSMWMAKKYEIISYFVALDKDTGELTSAYSTDLYKKAWRKLNDWYNKGYIRSDIASVTNDSSDANARRYVVSDGTWKPGQEESILQTKGYEVKYAPVSEPYKGLGFANSTMIAISRNSKNPEKALKFIELVNTDKELYNLICFGIKGKHYNLDENGQVEFIENSGYMPNADWKFGNQYNAYTIKGQPKDVWEQTKAQNDNAKVSPLNGFTLDNSQFLQIYNEVDTANRQAKNLITCKPEEFDAVYEENYQMLVAAGLDKLVDNVKEQVEEWKKSQN